MNGRTNPSRNQGQNFLPRLTAIPPVRTGKNNGSRIRGIANKNSMLVY